MNPVHYSDIKAPETFSPVPEFDRTLKLPNVIEDFNKNLSFEAAHKKKPVIIPTPYSICCFPKKIEIDASMRPFETDVEPDDLESFVAMLNSLSDHFKKTGDVVDWEIIVTQGDTRALEEKEYALKVIVAYFVQTGLLDPRQAQALHFYKDEPNQVEPDKLKGYHNIYLEFLPLGQQMESLLTDLYPEAGAPVEAFYQKVHERYEMLEEVGAEDQFELHSFCIAPMHRTISFLMTEKGQRYLKGTALRAYGSFNIKEGIKQSGDPAFARVVEAFFSRIKTGVIFEGYLAARMEERDPKGKAIRETAQDLNRASASEKPELYKALDKTKLGKAVKGSIIGWNKPNYDKWCGDLKKMYGEEFLLSIQAAKTRGEAIALYRAAFEKATPGAETPEDQRKAHMAIKDKGEFKCAVVQAMTSSSNLQLTISDIWLSTICANPSLINPECLKKCRVTIEGKDNNTVFNYTEKGRVYGLERLPQGPGRWDIPALDFERGHEFLIKTFST